jgi:ABC-2 type transport system permease protein
MSQEPTTPGFERLSLRTLWAYYLGKLKIDIANNLAYRGSVAIWVLSTVMQPLVSLVVWRTVAGSNDGMSGGFTANQYTAYFVTVMLVNHMTFIWHMWEFEWRIRTGFFSPILLRPIHPIHHDVSENLSYKLVGLAGVIPAAIILALVFNADFDGTSTIDMLAFLPALVLAMALRFILEWTLALAAFWMTKVSALNSLFDVFFLFLGGQFAPLSVMPDWIQTLAAISPFRWSIAFPVEVALGRLSGQEILTGYVAQAGWIAAAVIVLRLIWTRAASKYSAVGA